MKRLLVAIACGVAGPAWADDVLYKCVDAQGAVSIQSTPCPKASKEVWKRDTAAMAASAATLPPLPAPSATGMPVPAPSATPAAPVAPGKTEAAPPPDRSLASASVESLAPIGPPPPPPDPCDQAKDVVAQLRDMPWLELTPDQQQRLVRWVMEQCRPADQPN